MRDEPKTSEENEDSVSTLIVMGVEIYYVNKKKHPDK